jgi:vancomycin resistance protein YoaR
MELFFVSKRRNMLLVFLLIAVQSAIAVFAGVAALYAVSQETLPSGVTAGDVSIGGMSYPEAAKALENAYADQFKTGSIKLETEKKSFEIPYSQLNAKVDGAATVDSFRAEKSLSGISMLLEAYFGKKKPSLTPVVNLNEGKLREALLPIAEKLHEDPVDAEIIYKDGTIEKKSEIDGVALNVSNAAALILKQAAENPWQPIRLDRSHNFELQPVQAEYRLKDYEEIEQVLASYSTKIVEEELMDSISLAVDSINGIVLPATVNKADAEPFSFVEWLMKENADFENDNEGYDQVASTLYAALLTAGVPYDSITRLRHTMTADYIDPGLDAWISGSAGDLKFINPFSHKLAIFALIEGNRVKVVVAGDARDRKENSEITTEITQRIEPPVYNVENDSLKPGEKVVLNPGREGVVVNVLQGGKVVNTDEYEAEKAIVQIGPGTEWKKDGK